MNEEQVVRTYADMVYKIAYRYMQSPTDAEDVFSETFLIYFKKEREFRDEEHRKAWLIRVTINCAKDMLGGRKSDVELDEGLAEDESVASQPGEYLDLYTAIQKLRPEYREVICLHYLEGLSVKEIAEVLDKNENTIKSYLLRARERLKTFLEE